jgi:branched-chain amino acid transport system ATP-binding protein
MEGASICKFFAGLAAISDFDFRIREGEIVGLIGPNGAGKSTLIRTISGLTRSFKGEILYNGKDITRLKASEIVGIGISQVPEGRKLFSGMTVQENLTMGAYGRKDKAAVAADLRFIYELFPRLDERKKQLAGTMSGGEQQIDVRHWTGPHDAPQAVAYRRTVPGALAAAREAPPRRDRKDLRAMGDKHPPRGAGRANGARICRPGVCPRDGRIVLSGLSSELLADPRIKQSYLGI